MIKAIFFFPCGTACMILVPPLGLNPGATAVKAPSLDREKNPQSNLF